MDDGSVDRHDSGDPVITLLRVNHAYWMYEGAEFLNAMLLGRGYYPRPVRCIEFQDRFALTRFLGKGPTISDFWGINPDIVERLRRDEELLEIAHPHE